MAINLDAIKSRLNKLQNTQRTTVELWKPAPGKHTIRLVPYKFNKENPFIELYFHYNINNKTYLSPMSFGRPGSHFGKVCLWPSEDHLQRGRSDNWLRR